MLLNSWRLQLALHARISRDFPSVKFLLPPSIATRFYTAKGSSPLHHQPPSPLPPSHPTTRDRSYRENIITIPNGLTLFRIALSPFIGWWIVQGSFETALGGLLVAGATDVLDGWIARRFGLKTVIGSVLDPMADKILMTTLVVALIQSGSLSLLLGALILSRDALLIAGTAYYRYTSLAPPKTVQRYFDFSLPSAEVHPPLISKLNTFAQLGLMGGLVAGSAYGFVDAPWMVALQYLVGVTTVWSGATYYWNAHKLVKVLKAPGSIPKK